MKIVHVVSTYPPYLAGMGNVTYREASLLAARGHEVHVATLSEAGQAADVTLEDGVWVHRYPAFPRWGKAGVSMGCIRLMRDTSFEVVHLHAPFFGVQEVFVLLLWVLGRTQHLVLTYHMDIMTHGWTGMIAQLSRWMCLPTLIRTARVLCVGSMEYARESWLMNTPEAASKLVALPFGVDTERFYPAARKPSSTMQILFLGGLDRAHYFKGLGVLIEALALRAHMDWECVVVGDGDLRTRYEAQAERAGLAGQMRFVGRAKEEAPQYYRQADVFVFPSVDRSEAFGLVALEAQASGTPVIASDLAGVRTVVAHQETGLLVPPGDVAALAAALEWMQTHPQERAQMGEAARLRVEKQFTWTRHIDGLEAAYQR